MVYQHRVNDYLIVVCHDEIHIVGEHGRTIGSLEIKRRMRGKVRFLNTHHLAHGVIVSYFRADNALIVVNFDDIGDSKIVVSYSSLPDQDVRDRRAYKSLRDISHDYKFKPREDDVIEGRNVVMSSFSELFQMFSPVKNSVTNAIDLVRRRQPVVSIEDSLCDEQSLLYTIDEYRAHYIVKSEVVEVSSGISWLKIEKVAETFKQFKCRGKLEKPERVVTYKSPRYYRVEKINFNTTFDIKLDYQSEEGVLYEIIDNAINNISEVDYNIIMADGNSIRKLKVSKEAIDRSVVTKWEQLK